MAAANSRLGEAFERAPNALNLLRLFFAIEVIAWHSYALQNHQWLPDRATALLRDVGVDCFFVISGFLICRSWQRAPDPLRYLKARARRILPGLWVCLVVTGFVVVPIATALAGAGHPALSRQLAFVIGNATTWLNVRTVGGPSSSLGDRVWNEPLWSLGFESACYLIVALLGVTFLLRGRVVLGLAATCWLFSLADALGVFQPAYPLAEVPRLGLMFTAGAALWFYRDVIPVRRDLLALAGLTFALSPLAADYRLVAAPAAAYLCIVGSLYLGRHPRLVLSNDISYGTYIYGFPIQQTFVVTGNDPVLPLFILLSLACIVPVALASWFLVERPALGRSARRPSPTRPSPGNPVMPDNRVPYPSRE